jgi:ABC-type antimicrobial peptide transport system permease subunit
MGKKSIQKPPKVARKAFEWWSKKADTEDLLGDIDEYFQYNIAEKGKFAALIIYFKQILSLSFSYALKKRKRSASYSSYYYSNSPAMVKNYFKIAVRNFSKHKLFTSINILGLALGMSICLLALSIGVSIYSSDEFHEKKDRIFQVNTFIEDENTKTYGSTFHALGDYMGEKYPFIERVVKIKEGFKPEFKHHGHKLDFRGYFANESFFEVFSFPLISGNPETVLAKPFDIVLTKTVAETLFKDQDPIGQILETEYGSFNVTGVMADLKQTHLYFQVLTSYETYEQLQSTIDLKSDWVNYRNNYVYLLLKPETNAQTLSDALAQVSEKASEFNPNHPIALESIVLDKVVPRWNISNALGIGWDQPSLIFFMSIGLLILLPAVFNYTNLSIARALKRAKEIGIRKVVGAEKGQIKAQFIVETVILSFLALIGSFFIYVFIKKEFLEMVAAAEVLDTSVGFTLVTAFILFALVVGVVSGLFPALYFSRMNPIRTLKGEIINRSSSVSGIKKGLFVFQFFVSLVFVIGVTAIAKEYSNVFSHNHGFESNNILTVPFQDIDKQIAINELKSHPDVKAITTSSNLPGIFLPGIVEVTPNEKDTIEVNEVFIGDDFIENMEMSLVWGESENLTTSTQNEELVLVNEQFIRSAAVFGERTDSLSFILADGTKCRIAGVLKDLNFEPLSVLINPLILRHSLEESNYALLTINSTDIKKTVDELDILWTNIDQKSKFEATFLDDEIEDAYYFLTAQIKIFSFLSAFAIAISCLGLLGMVSYTTENRTKEIAVRKIMGATVPSIYYLLTKDFIKLIIIASLIAIPFSYVFYDKLFLYFLIRYGSGLGVLEVVLSIGFLFLIGFISIFWQTSQVANANPAGNLRYE